MSPVGSGEDLPVGVFHLISAHEVAPRWRLNPDHVALCGALVTSSSLSGHSGCLDEGECECEVTGTLAYCSACLRAALEQNHRAGDELGSSRVAARGR